MLYTCISFICELFSKTGCQVYDEKIEAGMKDTKRIQAKFKVLGMSCASCVNKIEKYVAGKAGSYLHIFYYLYNACMYTYTSISMYA